ncbi:hypothetical protein [Bacillus alkalicellulosilyticus]|uniref:hypothetical protein n=1 Tax=Alkalihalobacterium alkalicellulosilyticum TaxID=1912214 RepID=UPI001115C319|nr:hypothetical protein [Bacillus alkalicellulosilyticus]
MKQRLFLCILLAFALIYFALPRLPIGAEGLAGVFAFSWLLFALIVIGGNLVGLLYSKQVKSQRVSVDTGKVENMRKIRRYER